MKLDGSKIDMKVNANVEKVRLTQEIGKTVGAPLLKENIRISCRNVDVYYNRDNQAIFDVSVDLAKNQILAINFKLF